MARRRLLTDKEEEELETMRRPYEKLQTGGSRAPHEISGKWTVASICIGICDLALTNKRKRGALNGDEFSATHSHRRRPDQNLLLHDALYDALHDAQGRSSGIDPAKTNE